MRVKYLLFSIFFLFLSLGCSVLEDSHITINNTRIELVDIADNMEKAYNGLSFRESICEDCGMLFPFNVKDKRTFVMRDMMFPLDIVWIDDDKIVKIDKNLKPEGHEVDNFYNSIFPVNNVLELNGGYTDKNNIKVGDTIKYSIVNYEFN